MFIISHAIKHNTKRLKMKLSDLAMLAAISLMLLFIAVKNSEHKTTTFNNVVASVQNNLDK
jgi:hypothetical protein